MVIGLGISPRSVQCQRTRRYITRASADGRTSICPHCADGETYLRVDVDHHAGAIVRAAIAMCRMEFAVVDDGLSTLVWLGEEPEHVFEKLLHSHHIYLARDADPRQIMFSGAQEAFHRVCTPNNQPNWAHEMLSLLSALQFLDRMGETGFADRNRTWLAEQAPPCSLEQMLSLDAVPYPEGLYGRAYVVGEALIAAIGWDTLKPLALARDRDGMASVETWLESLAPGEREMALRVLSGAA